MFDYFFLYIFSDDASRIPNCSELLDNCLEIGGDALKEVEASCTGGDQMETSDSLVKFVHGLAITENENWKCFVRKVCLSMLDRIKDIRFLMPNKLITALVEWVESVTCNVNERVSLLILLNLPSHFNAVSYTHLTLPTKRIV